MEKFKINELAKIFDISRQTLIYYDKIGLLKPYEVDLENSYRYYSKNQIIELSFIILLKKSGMSLNDIKEYTKIRKASECFEFLKNKEKDLDIRIENLKKTRRSIKHQLEILNQVTSEELEKARIENIDEFYIKKVDLTKYKKYESIDAAFLDVYKLSVAEGIDNYTIFVSLRIASIFEKKYEDFKTIALFSSYPKDGFEKIEKGLYASINYKGAYKNIGDSYEKLTRFIKEKKYEIISDPIEFSDNSLLYVEDGVGGMSKLCIPIKKIT